VLLHLLSVYPFILSLLFTSFIIIFLYYAHLVSPPRSFLLWTVSLRWWSLLYLPSSAFLPTTWSHSIITRFSWRKDLWFIRLYHQGWYNLSDLCGGFIIRNPPIIIVCALMFLYNCCPCFRWSLLHSRLLDWTCSITFPRSATYSF